MLSRLVKKSESKIAVFIFLSFLMIGEVSAQLITDSDRRLKTQKAKEQPSTGGASTQPSKSPFSAFRKKAYVERRSINGLKSFFADKSAVTPRTASNKKETKTFFPQSTSRPKYSSGSPYSSKGYVRVTPRSTNGRNPFEGYSFSRSPKYSAGQVWSPKDLYKSPRYSVGQPYKRYNYIRSPKYSVGQVWSPKDLYKSPRYSVGDPYKRYNYIRSPKYSVGNVWSDKDKNKSPRYSSNIIWSKKDLYKSPRYSVGDPYKGYSSFSSPKYSVGNVWSNEDKNKSPRYSTNIIWSKKDLNKSPRYSIGAIWSKEDLNKSPRYSIGNPYDGYKFLNVPPKYSSDKNRFVIDKRYNKENTVLDLEAGSYLGDFKMDWKKTKNMHPSFSHHNADQSLEVMRESMRKWNIFWVRLNTNQVDPKGVKEKVEKPKFDKKEVDIWND